MHRMLEAWERCSPSWQAAFSQAWRSFTSDTVPVGAAVVDPRGELAAVGRNRIYEPADRAEPGQLAGTWLAHAEVNAIAQLGSRRSTATEGWSVRSTLEPCPLCLGAITVAFRGRIRLAYASPDPIGGAVAWRDGTDLGRSRSWHVETLGGPLAQLAELLLAAYTLRVEPGSRLAGLFTASAWGDVVADIGATLVDAGRARRPLEAVLEPIGEVLHASQPGSVLRTSG